MNGAAANEPLSHRFVGLGGPKTREPPDLVHDRRLISLVQLDRQPAHMRAYVDLPDDGNPRNDNGGVHINSGIPNKAFHLTATRLGGNAWERAGKVWYDALAPKLGVNSNFADAAAATVASAQSLFGAEVAGAVRASWNDVGVS